MADFSTTPMQTAAVATGVGTAMDVRNAASAMIHIQAGVSPVGTITFEGTLDPDPLAAAALWFPVAMRATTQVNATTLVTTATAPGAFVLPREYALAQIRASLTYTSGTWAVVGTRRST